MKRQNLKMHTTENGTLFDLIEAKGQEVPGGIDVKPEYLLKKCFERSQNTGETFLNQDRPSENLGGFLTIEELAKFANLKVSMLRSLVFKKEIPFLKIGRLIRFKKSEILQWINGKKISG